MVFSPVFTPLLTIYQKPSQAYCLRRFLAGFFNSDIFLNYFLTIASVVYLRLVLENGTGGGVDLVAILHAAGLELDLIDERAVLVVQLDLHVIRFIFAHARVVQGNGLRLGMANVLHCSGRIGF